MVCLDLIVATALDQHLDRIGVVSGISVDPLIWDVLFWLEMSFGGSLTTMAVNAISETTFIERSDGTPFRSYSPRRPPSVVLPPH